MTDNPWLQQQIHAERVKAIYKQAIITSINSWITGLLFVFIPNNNPNKYALYLWFAAISLSCISRILVALQFKRRDIPIKDHPRWGLYYAAAVLSTALIWASSLFVLVVPGDTQYQLFTMMVLVALCIGASHASTTYPLVGQVYNVPVMLSFVISCILTGSTGFYVMAIMGSLFALMMFVVGQDSDKRFREIQELRFELAQKREDAENANIAKSKFLAAASHDLRQPLHALTLFIGLLKEKITYPDVLKIVDNIESSVEALQSLFNSLLDISKLDAGTIEVERSDFALSNILQTIENEFKAEAKHKNIHFLIEPSSHYVRSDINLLNRILRNLVSNSIRYTEDGSVLILCKQVDKHIDIEVRDTGVGIAKEDQKHIFDEFVQVGNSERDRNKGLGLGLAIVKRLTKLMDHELTFNSQPGVGTSFFVKLPIAKKAQTQNLDAIPSALNVNITLDNLKVIFVDDEVDIRQGTTSLLTSWGCEVISFEASTSALEYISKNQWVPDVILADYRLEDHKTGIEVIADIIHLVAKDIPAAIITGDTAADRIKEATNSGHTLLHKPVKPMQLRAYLNRINNRIKTSELPETP